MVLFNITKNLQLQFTLTKLFYNKLSKYNRNVILKLLFNIKNKSWIFAVIKNLKKTIDNSFQNYKRKAKKKNKKLMVQIGTITQKFSNKKIYGIIY